MPGVAEVAHDRADVDDPRRRAAAQLRQQAAGELHRREHVGLHDALEHRVVLRLEPREVAGAGVVDEQVRLRERHRGAPGRGGEVGDQGARHRPGGAARLVEARGVAADQQERLAVRRERSGDGLADAAARAGENGPVAFHEGSPLKMSP